MHVGQSVSNPSIRVGWEYVYDPKCRALNKRKQNHSTSLNKSILPNVQCIFFFLPPTVDPDKWNPLQRFNTPVMFIFPAKMFPGQVDLVGFLIVREFSETKFDTCFKSSITMQCTIVVHILQILVRFFPNKRELPSLSIHHTLVEISSQSYNDFFISECWSVLNSKWSAHFTKCVLSFYVWYNSVTKTSNTISISFSHSSSSVIPVHIWENVHAWFCICIVYASSRRNSTGRTCCLISPAVTAAFYPTSCCFFSPRCLFLDTLRTW